jgi:purine-binding chemotaxis protein CheW
MTVQTAIRPSAVDDAENGASDQEEMFVTLTVAEQLCGIPVLAVRDILGPQTITRIPLAPPEVSGSLNLRGRIVTTIDLRCRLQLPPQPAGAAPMSVVAEQGGELYALLVDQVAEVLSLPRRQFERNPPTMKPEWSRFSSGIYRLQDRLLAVLDVPQLLSLSPRQTARSTP